MCTYSVIKRSLLLLAVTVCSLATFAQTDDKQQQIDKVYVIFKTHLDVGFTDLSSAVTERYMNDFIPKALEVNERLRADGMGERYVWTTGSWIVWKYLQTATGEEVERLEDALRRGDIVWNAVPYTVESESMNKELLQTLLLLSKRLDKRFGKHTIAAKMTDVPGHTRSIIGPMADAGIRFLHVGVNPASPIPAVPPFCRWRDEKGKELILVYQQDYGTEDVLPDGHTVVSVNFTGDNHGPHPYEQVKQIYAGLRKRYPGATLVPASFNEVAHDLLKVRKQLPIVTSEIGDTWIYGYGSAPIRMAKFRRLTALYAQWVKEKRIDMRSDAALNFAVELGLIAEHTQGMDVKTHLGNWDKYDMDLFLPARSSAPYRKMETSWREIDDYLLSATAYLPEDLRQEAVKAMESIDHPQLAEIGDSDSSRKGEAWAQPLLDGRLLASGLSYQQFDAADFDDYLNRYLRARYGWALDDIGKTGLDKSHAVSATLQAQIVSQTTRQEAGCTRIITNLAFPVEQGVDPRCLPRRMQTDCLLYPDGSKAELWVTIMDKPAVRLPESYWLSFRADGIRQVLAQKIGSPVDVMDVVERGNRQMHGIDRYVDILTDEGGLRIRSDEAFLINIGEARGLAYSTSYPQVEGGVHFNLSNNLWGTNFTMWSEGSLTYHFIVEPIKSRRRK